MERKIIFRGKRLDNGEWIIGDLIRINGYTFIFPDPAPDGIDRYMVDPATVGQFTGSLDKTGKEIYEGDKLLIKGNATAVVVWRNEGFDIFDTRSWTPTNKGDIEGFVYVPTNAMEIIGNIHDNKELIEKE